MMDPARLPALPVRGRTGWARPAGRLGAGRHLTVVPFLQCLFAVLAACWLVVILSGHDPRFHSRAADLVAIVLAGLTVFSSVYATQARLARTRLLRQNLLLERQAYTDALTGLGNRRWFDERLLACWDDGAADHTMLSIILIDIDQFKAYNDAFGHVEGDRILRSLGGVLQQAGRRSVDQGFRFGGEEFVMLLPGTSLPGAGKVAAEIQQAVAGLAIPHPASGTGLLTVSMGVAQAFPARREDEREAFLVAADGALYQAKREGRNKIKMASFQTGREMGIVGSKDVRVDGCDIIMANGRTVRISSALDTATLSSILQVVGAQS